GFLFGIPSIAFSLEEKGWAHLDSAAQVAAQIVKRAIAHPLPGPSLLSVNIPSRPISEMTGIHVTRLGRRHPSEPVAKTLSPFGQEIFWIGPAGKVADNAPGTDFHAVANGAVSVTPLKLDLTNTDQIQATRSWLDLG